MQSGLFAGCDKHNSILILKLGLLAAQNSWCNAAYAAAAAHGAPAACGGESQGQHVLKHLQGAQQQQQHVPCGTHVSGASHNGCLLQVAAVYSKIYLFNHGGTAGADAMRAPAHHWRQLWQELRQLSSISKQHPVNLSLVLLQLPNVTQQHVSLVEVVL
jgi:hypothetical protein